MLPCQRQVPHTSLIAMIAIQCSSISHASPALDLPSLALQVCADGHRRPLPAHAGRLADMMTPSLLMEHSSRSKSRSRHIVYCCKCGICGICLVQQDTVHCDSASLGGDHSKAEVFAAHAGVVGRLLTALGLSDACNAGLRRTRS